MSLKQSTVSGLTWNFGGNFINSFVAFIIGIILARLLTPREYGLVGMINIFIILTQPFVNSGFSQALIRKRTCTQTDFSTVFYFNFLVGVICYLILYFSAPYISSFFKEPQLTLIARIVGLIIIIDSTVIIQNTILTINLNFKLLTKISLFSSLLSGLLGIVLAYKGYGVWSLVYRTLVHQLLNSAMLWINNRWNPGGLFSFRVLKELFGFSSKLLASAILDKVYFNIYNLIVAKYFSAKELGLFTRAKMFKDMGSEIITEIISKVSFPVLAKCQDEPVRLKNNYKIFLTCTMFIVLPLMFGLSAVSESLILALLGEKWKETIIFLQLLAFVGIFYPMSSLTRDLLYIYGKSGLVLKLEILAKALVVPAIIIGVKFGIKYMIIAMIITSFIDFLFKAYYSGRLLNYTVWEQIKDFKYGVFLAICIGIVLFFIGKIGILNPIVTLLIQISTSVIIFIGLSEILRISEYMFIKGIIFEKLNKGIKK